MSPKTPENPQQGKASDTSPEDAAAAKQASADVVGRGGERSETGARKSAEQPEPVESEGGTPSAEGPNSTKAPSGAFMVPEPSCHDRKQFRRRLLQSPSRIR